MFSKDGSTLSITLPSKEQMAARRDAAVAATRKAHDGLRLRAALHHARRAEALATKVNSGPNALKAIKA